MEERKPKTRRLIDIYTAGCSTCDNAVKLVRELAGDTHELRIHDMHKADVAQRAKNLGVRSLPAVVIDGKLAGCCAGRGPDEDTLRRELGRHY